MSDDLQKVPVLVGSQGWVTGEVYILKDRETVIVGRSRSCDVSLRRIASYLNRPQAVRDADRDFNTVSRRHARLTIADDEVSLEDLSTNGCFVDDQAVTGGTSFTISPSGTTIRLGTRETLTLELVDPARLEELQARTSDQAVVNRPDNDDHSGLRDSDLAEDTLSSQNGADDSLST